MKLHVVVPGKIVGKNQSRGIVNGRFYVPKETKLFMRRVAVACWMAAREWSWPDAFAVAECSYFIQRFNVKGDSDRGNTIVVDSMQYRRWPTPKGESKLPGPVGLFANDADAWCSGSPLPIKDDGGPRLEIDVTLRAIRAPHAADELRKRWYANESRRALRRTTRLNNKEFVGKKKSAAVSAAARRSADELAHIEDNLGIRLPL